MAVAGGTSSGKGDKPNFEDLKKIGNKDFTLGFFTELEEAKNYVKQGKMPDIKGMIARMLSKFKNLISSIMDQLRKLFDFSAWLDELGIRKLAETIFGLLSDILGVFGINLWDKVKWLNSFVNDCLRLNLEFTNAYGIPMLTVEELALSALLLGLICSGDVDAFNTADKIFGKTFHNTEVAKHASRLLRTGKSKKPVKILTQMSDKGIFDIIHRYDPNPIKAIGVFVGRNSKRLNHVELNIVKDLMSKSLIHKTNVVYNLDDNSKKVLKDMAITKQVRNEDDDAFLAPEIGLGLKILT